MGCGCRRRHHHCNWGPGPQPVPDTPIMGGWTNWRQPNTAEQQIFTQAVSGLIGATYAPLYVKSQVVQGTNYLFYATQTITTGTGTTTNYVYVRIYVDLQGNVQLLSINNA